ncbi:hypothetical protein RRF57_006488 [Xylaria bambusicola]|uniref:Heterokaryon incompatibility domain-containing protein n=1 Tax=Xylaria bambusicola TaxID=326684 RepID=A0AAN7Z951_9PEZI
MQFFGDEIPPYAILSHTWGKEEVTFQDLQTLEHKSKQGYVKIEQTCRRAARKGCEWVWIDTCCIDKSSSAELSEAINSMFEWYQKAEICYVFLADVPPSENLEHIFRQARWLTRGWTLQEFLAPRFISLLNSEWEDINPENFPFAPLDLRRVSFEQGLLGYITGINVHRWRDADIPTKLSWAARRQTSRTEDMAYCLLGLLDINMPLLYGEGTRAFTRLLEEVMKRSNSHGLLAAGYDLPVLPSLHLLPKSPRAYAACAQKFSNVPVFGTSKSLHFSMTNAGLNIELPLVNIDNKRKIVLGLLNCRDVAKLDNPQLAIALRQANDDRSDQLYYPVSQPLSVPSDFHQSACRENIYIADSRFSRTRCLLALYYKSLKDIGYQFHSLYPPSLVETIIDMDTSYIYSEAADTLVLLFTTVIHRPNIVFLVPASYVAPQASR